MPLVFAHVRMRRLSLFRTPAYVAGTLAMPSVILIFIGMADTTAAANAIMPSFTVFTVMGVSFCHFGVGIAEGSRSGSRSRQSCAAFLPSSSPAVSRTPLPSRPGDSA